MNSATPANAAADSATTTTDASDEVLDEAPGVFVGAIAIDGPSGSGKSTVARRLASRLGVTYLDTGAMYRAVTWAVLRAGVDPADTAKVVQVAAQSELVVSTDPTAQSCAIDGVDVTAPIRGADITQAVSAVAANPAVRQGLVAHQQAIIADAPRGIVVEGRDIAGVVAPEAVLKVYLTASPEARARRRHGENAGTAASTDTTSDVASTDVAAVAQDLQRRDELDSTRATDPLCVADGAVVLDTTDRGIDAVVDHLIELHAAALTARPTAALHAAPSKAESV